MVVNKGFCLEVVRSDLAAELSDVETPSSVVAEPDRDLEAIKLSLAAGEYERPEVLDALADRLIDDGILEK